MTPVTLTRKGRWHVVKSSSEPNVVVLGRSLAEAVARAEPLLGITLTVPKEAA